MNKLSCPNCELPMVMIGSKAKFEGEFYDKWVCRECSHIIVLDYRGEYNE